MTNTTPTAATRTVTLTIAVPIDARRMTTDFDGTVCFWHEPEKGKCITPHDVTLAWHGGGAIETHRTRIPCPHWRDTLIDLAPEPATKETT